MSKYTLAVFDVDGTVLDTSEGILEAVKHTIEHFGLQPLSEDRISEFIGPPIQDSFAKAYSLEGDIIQDIANVFRDKYKTEEYLLKAIPYDGIDKVFEKLLALGVKPAIATYKRHDYAVTLLKHFKFDRYTDIIYGGDNENKLKKCDIIEKCIADSGVTNKSHVLMIGDTNNDAVGAELIGIDFAAVTYGFGFHPKQNLNNIKHIGCADTPADLLRFFE